MTEEADYQLQTLSAREDGGRSGSAVVAAPDDPSEWISDSSAVSTVTDEGERRFNAGNLALKFVLLLIWAYAGFRVYEVYRLVQLLQSMQRTLEALGPALDTTVAVDQQKSDPIIAWLIAVLAYSLAVTAALFAALFYVVFAHLLRCSSCSNNGRSGQSLSAKRIKCMLRTMGTLLFYFVLLPEAIGILVLSGMVTSTGKLADKRVKIGAISLDKILAIGHSFGCNGTEFTNCWMPDEANMTRVSRQFYLPMREHLRQSHLPEAFSQMALILVAFVVTHLIRGRGTWEVDHRQLLEQTAFLRLAEQRRSAGLVINAQNPVRLDGWRRKKNI